MYAYLMRLNYALPKIYYCGKISLQSVAGNCTFSDNLWGNIYFAYDGTMISLPL